MKASISRVQLPAKFSPLTVKKTAPRDWDVNPDKNVVRATARKFGTSYSVALGLIKDLQGPVTLAFHRMAKVAFLKIYDPFVVGEKRADLLASMHLTEKDIAVYTTAQISLYVHQFYADAGEACMTEVLMDRRKYKIGDPDRYDAALDNLMALISGRASCLDPEAFKDGNGDKIHKGETTVNVDAINTLVSVLDSTVNQELGRYPVTNALVGDLTNRKAVALAKAINAQDMDAVLDIVNANTIEMALPVSKPHEREDREINRCVRGKVRQTWHDNTASYMEKAVYSANEMEDAPCHDLHVSVDRFNIKVTYLHVALPTISVPGLGIVNGVTFKTPMPDLREVEAQSHEVGGFTVHANGVPKSFARHSLICLNRNAGKQIENGTPVEKAITKYDIRLVTVMDVLAHAIVGYMDTFNTEVWRQDKMGFTDTWVKQVSREFRTHVTKTITSYVRPIGADYHDDGVIYDTVDMLPLQASLEQIEAMPEASTQIKTHMLGLIATGIYNDPLRKGVTHRFSVGGAPKGGSFAHVTKTHGETARILVSLVGQPGQHNTDRAEREASGLATAWPLLKTNNVIHTIWDGLMPELMTRATDLVYGYVPAEGIFTNGEGKNPDPIYLTLKGIDNTQYATKQIKHGPMTSVLADAKAKEITGDTDATVETLEVLGWKVVKSYRFQGFLDSVDVAKHVPGANRGQDVLEVSTEMITLVSPEPLRAPKGRKIGWSGTKSVGVPVNADYYFRIGGKKVFIDVVAAIETMEQKKLQGDVVTGQGVLLGKTHFDGTETPSNIEDHLEDLKEIASPNNGSIVYRTSEDGKVTKHVQYPLYDGNDNLVGYCIPAIHRSFVMKENEDLAYTQKKNGMSKSPWALNLFGGEVKVSDSNKEIMEMLSALIVAGADMDATLKAEAKEKARRK